MGPTQLDRQRRHRLHERVAEGGGGPVPGQVHEHEEPGRALDEGPDRGLLVLADDEITLPVPGNGPVGDLERALGDHDHRVGVARLTLLGHAAGFATSAPGAQRGHELAPQPAARLDVDRLIDRLCAHVHLRPAGEAGPEHDGDLFRTPPQVQMLLDEVS